MRELGTIETYADLHRLIRARREALNISLATVDDVAGTTTNYASKIFAPAQTKRLGACSFGPILATLGIRLVAYADDQALDKLRHRLVQRSPDDVLRIEHGTNTRQSQAYAVYMPDVPLGG